MLRLRFALLVAIVAVTAHDATYAIGHSLAGYATALGASGHDGYWQPVALGVVGTLVAALVATVARWWSLRRQLAAHPAAGGHRLGRIAPGALRLGARLLLAGLAVFLVQENLEALAIGAPAPGPGLLMEPAYAAVLPVLAAVALLFATLSELIDARIVDLRRRLAIVRAALPRASRSTTMRPPAVDRVRQGAITAQPDLGRAPPASVFARS